MRFTVRKTRGAGVTRCSHGQPVQEAPPSWLTQTFWSPSEVEPTATHRPSFASTSETKLPCGQTERLPALTAVVVA